MQDVADDPHRAISLPVIFFDGEKETAIGDVLVSSSLQFRDFQLVLGQRIGLSSNQFTVFFTERRKRQRSWPRKLQITPKFNFASITGSKESYFLVVLKRSRRRERVEKRRFDGFENVVLLRREDGPLPRFSGHQPVASVVGPSGVERLAMELELELWNWQGQDQGGLIRGEPVFCHECDRRRANEEGTDSGDGFHWCANDAVTAGFRSRAGPIARPVKNEMFFPAFSDFDRFWWS